MHVTTLTNVHFYFFDGRYNQYADLKFLTDGIIQQENKVLMSVMWNEGTQQLNAHVIPVMHEWFGCSQQRVRDLSAAAAQMEACGYRYTKEHGMVEHRRKCPPPNQTSEKWIRLLYTHFDIFTRPSPEAHGGVVRATATQSNMQTYGDLADGFFARYPEAALEMTGNI
jgi:hypothetical protein